MAETYYVKPENSPVEGVTLNSFDAMYITSDGIAIDTVINSGGAATVNDGGSAQNTTVNEGGTLHLLGGTATGVTVTSKGRLEVNKGATATEIIAENGAILAFDVAPNTQIVGVSGRSSFQIRNGVATGFVLETGVLTISNGGVASDTVLNSAGNITVYEGGTAFKAVVNNSGEIKVFNGGIAESATVTNGGKLTVDSGGLCDGAIVNRGGKLDVVSSGGIASGTYVDAMGNLTVSHGGTARGTTVGANGFLTVGTKGIADGADVNGYLNVLEGGLASNVTVNEGAVVYVQGKGTGSEVNVDDGGFLEVLPDGRLKGATVAQGGSATIHADVIASNVVIDGGKVTVMRDGWAYQDGVSSNTIVKNGGQLIINGGGRVEGAVVFDGGHVVVENDGILASATVTAADVTAQNGATVSRFNLESGGILNVESGGKAEHINVSAGGVLTGVLREASELRFYGGTLELNISGVSPDNEFLVDDRSFSAIMAGDDFWTLTVSGTQDEGTYNLIEDATGFDKTITVKNTLGATLGTLLLGGKPLVYGAASYTLGTDMTGLLSVTVGKASATDTTPPEVVNVTADETALTNRNVTVTAEFTDNAGFASGQYRIGESGKWTDYPSGGVTMEENGTVYFKAIDATGNESEIVSQEVANIDKVAPTVSGITPSTKDPADSVTVTASFKDDVVLATRLYRLGASGEWTDYFDEGVVVTANTTVYFKAVDAAGNESEVAEYTVNNIGTVLPEPDGGWNDYLYKKDKGMSNGGWNTDGNIAKFASNTVTGNQEIFLDVPGTIDTDDGKHNLFGNDGTNKDAGDVAKISVAYAAKLTFEINSTAAGSFCVYRYDDDGNGNRKMITVGKKTVKKNTPAKLEDVLLTSDADKYYVAMNAKNVSKVGPEYYGLYNVKVVKSTFFVDADEGEYENNSWFTARTVSVNPGDKRIVLDGKPMEGDTAGTFRNFVGFTDTKDYARLDLASSAYMRFRITAMGASKFIIWKQRKGTSTSPSKVSVTTLLSKKKNTRTTNAVFFDTSKYNYYISMTSTNAAKGASVYYNVEIDSKSVFFDGDNGHNNVLFDKTKKDLYSEDDTHHFETTTIDLSADDSEPPQHVKFDTNPVVDTDWDNFVGYGDSTDYAKIRLTSAGNLSFNIRATGNAKFTVYRLEQDGKGKKKLKAIHWIKLKLPSSASFVSKTIEESLEAGEYYVSMKANSTEHTAKGSVFYNVTATLKPEADSAALAMPETDVLADASASGIVDLNNMPGWETMLA